MKTETVLARYNEKFVKTYVIYADNDDGHVYYDSAKKNKIAKDDLKDLFMKGVKVFHTDTFYAPTAFKDSGSEAYVVVHNDTGNLTFYSAEHGAD